MDKVVHFEIPAEDIERAKKFYHDTFGWKINDVPGMDYTIVYTSETDENHMIKEKGAINGGMMKRKGKIKSPVITIQVESIEDVFNKVKINGGKMIIEKMSVGDMGFSAYIQDSEGNILGLWEPVKRQ